MMAYYLYGGMLAMQLDEILETLSPAFKVTLLRLQEKRDSKTLETSPFKFPSVCFLTLARSY